jgi:hypothetical protein
MTTYSSTDVVVGRSSEYRLNRRGRMVVGLIAVFFVAVLFFLLGTIFSAVVQAAEVSDQALTQYSTVLVMPGDSLWSIAKSTDPSADPREIIQLLVEINDLPGEVGLEVGQSLLVPIL